MRSATEDMYHLVSAVVLGFTTSIFTEGRIWAASPPCYIAVYFMTIGASLTFQASSLQDVVGYTS